MKDSTALISLSPAHISALEATDQVVIPKINLLPVPPIITVLPDPTGENRRLKRSQLKLHADDILVVYFGYMYRGKGIETLLRAMAQNDVAKQPVVLALIGTASDEQYGQEVHALSASLNLGSKVRWIGYCEDSEASLLLRSADICVLPFDQGLRLNNSSFATAAAHGLPVVSTFATPAKCSFTMAKMRGWSNLKIPGRWRRLSCTWRLTLKFADK